MVNNNIFNPMKRVYFLTFGLLLAVGAVTAQINLRTYDKGVTINGVKWATRNVDKPGTFTAKPQDVGMFFQWNRRAGWSATDPMVNSDGGSTWEDSDETGVVWKKSNDPSPVGWRMPNFDDLKKLLDEEKVKSEWTTENGVNGRKFTDRTSGKSIFLPAAGFRTYFGDGVLNNAGTDGLYWSCTAHELYESDAYFLDFYNGGAAWRHSYGRKFGFSVGFSIRCVAE